MHMFLHPNIGGEMGNVLKRGISDTQAIGLRGYHVVLVRLA